jgi:hypothetical protein
MCDTPLTITVTVSAEGYVTHHNVIVLEPTDPAPTPETEPEHEMEM